ncbi:hypothetical protein KEM54_002880, partial [Ascosphaera aggregata]
SPAFNGSDYYMPGDGEDVPHNGTIVGIYTVPSGNKGGYLKSRPFKEQADP